MIFASYLVSIQILSVFHLHLFALQHQPSQVYTGDYCETIPMQKTLPCTPLLYSGYLMHPRTYRHQVRVYSDPIKSLCVVHVQALKKSFLTHNNMSLPVLIISTYPINSVSKSHGMSAVDQNIYCRHHSIIVFSMGY